MTLDSGNVFEGEWADGAANGRGTITRTDGTVVHGVWQDGQMVEED